nr:retrovirus-related Pol polyprotein from transposon TNT 1-94 [Tanacetum cinerariifolium]
MMGQIIQCLGRKTGGLDQISNKDAIILYCLANEVQVDYAKLIWEDLIHKLNKKTWENIVPCPRRKQSSKHTSESQTEASKSKTGQSETETKSGLAKDKSPSHPSPPTLVVGEMHKEAVKNADLVSFKNSDESYSFIFFEISSALDSLFIPESFFVPLSISCYEDMESLGADDPGSASAMESAEASVNHNTTISRPQLKSNQSSNKVMPNNSQVKVKKTHVKVHPRIPSVSNKMKSVTACKDSLNSRTLNANAVCAICNKCLVDSNHFACVTKMLNDVHARTRKPTIVPISTRKPKTQTNKLVATPNKKKFTPILGYGDLVQGNVTINRVYYVEGLNHNLFLVGQFCDTDLEVAFRKSTCFVRDLQGNDFLIGNHGSDVYTISLQESTPSTSLCLMSKATPTQALLWHRRLSHLNFDYINLLSKKDIVIGLPKLKYIKDQLCSSCELSKAKRSSFKSKAIPSSKGWLNLLHMDLCGLIRVASINGKKYILVIIDDYSRYT